MRFVPLRRRLVPIKAAALSRVFTRDGVGPERLRALRLRQRLYPIKGHPLLPPSVYHGHYTGLVTVCRRFPAELGGEYRRGYAQLQLDDSWRVENNDANGVRKSCLM